jgi:hypothetical protein
VWRDRAQLEPPRLREVVHPREILDEIRIFYVKEAADMLREALQKTVDQEDGETLAEIICKLNSMLPTEDVPVQEREVTVSEFQQTAVEQTEINLCDLLLATEAWRQQQ